MCANEHSSYSQFPWNMVGRVVVSYGSGQWVGCVVKVAVVEIAVGSR